MKLKNKQTGEIVEIAMPIKDGDGWNIKASSLAELCEEWEDYEKPKELFIVDARHECCVGILNIEENPEWCARLIELGLGFETKEEADRTVEKLKAFTRLENVGFKFKEWKHTPLMETVDGYKIHIEAYTDKMVAIMKDLHLLFSEEVKNER